MPNVFFPRKKLTGFDNELTFTIEGNVYSITPSEVPCEADWEGILQASDTSVHVEISYGDRQFKKVMVEDWGDESLEGREYNLLVEVDEDFVVRPVLSLPVSDDGTGEEGELHFLLEPIKIPIEGRAMPTSGGSLFERGLAEVGRVNPDTVRYSVQCESCSKTFTFRSYHTGFLEVEYCYCDKSSQPLFIPAGDPLLDFKRPDVASQPDEFTPSEIAHARRRYELLEGKLPDSDYEGHFRWLAPFRCPHCSAPLIDFRNNLFRKAWEYYACCHKGHTVKHFSMEMPKKEESKKEADTKETGKDK